MTTIQGFEDLVLPALKLRAGDDPLPVSAVFEDEDPCTGGVFAEIPQASALDIDAVVAAANQAFRDPTWRGLAPLQRERLLHRFADAIEADLPRLAALEALDVGKPISLAEAVDVPAAVAWMRAYAGWPSKLHGRTASLSATPGEHHVYSRREPVGVVAAITPWNFPLVLAVWKVAHSASAPARRRILAAHTLWAADVGWDAASTRHSPRSDAKKAGRSESICLACCKPSAIR